MENENKVGFFTDEKGLKSMRRLLAFMFGFAELLVVAASIMFVEDWKLALVVCAPFLIGCVFCLFFTSWDDVAKVTKAVKGNS